MPASEPPLAAPMFSARTFSSPIVNFPVVTWLLSANVCSFRIASLCSTDTANLTLDLVYSCPGYDAVSHGSSFPCLHVTHVYYRIVRQMSQTIVQSLVHLRRVALEEPAAACNAN